MTQPVTVRTNRPAVLRSIRRICGALDLDGPGRGGSFGDELMDLAARRILARSRRQRAPGGGAWAPNRGRYGEMKRRLGLPVGVLTGQMLSEEEVRGRRRVTGPDGAWMRYGVTVAAYRKAGFFHLGTSRQVARPFFGIDADDEAALAERVDRRLARAAAREA